LADAATTGVEETVKLLLDRGAKVDVQDSRGYSALLYAAGSDAVSVPIVKMLLAKGANPQLKGDGETAPMLAAKRGDTEVARLLGVPESERKQLGVASSAAGESRETDRPVAVAVKLAFRSWNNRAIASFELEAATPAMRRICLRPPRLWSAIVGCRRPNLSLNCLPTWARTRRND
jgi:hypothetical protein